MRVQVALTRAVSPRLAECELTYLHRQPIDVRQASLQHDAYLDCLRAHGCQVIELPATPELPDSVFVEDTAVVLEDVAVITRPGAESRRPETESVSAELVRYRSLRRISEPGTLDGGDVLRVRKTLYVGRSKRSNDDGIEQLRRILAPLGYKVVAVEMTGCLHIKSAVTWLGDALLLNPEWVDRDFFGDLPTIPVHPEEPHAANALRLNDVLVYSATHVQTRRLLEQRGYRIAAVDASELEKAEAGVTCCSVVFDA